MGRDTFYIDNNTPLRHSRRRAGFTLVEMVVAVAVFLIAATVMVSVSVSMVDASRKARATRAVVENVNGALDMMARTIRTGSAFHCDFTVTSPALNIPRECPMTDMNGGGGATSIVFEDAKGDLADASDQIVFFYDPSVKRVRVSEKSGVAGSFRDLTAAEVSIESLRFYVNGTTVDADQPNVTIVISGTSGTKAKVRSSFHVQTTIGMRTPNRTAP